MKQKRVLIPKAVIPEPGARRRPNILRRGDEMSKKAALIRVCCATWCRRLSAACVICD